MTIRNKKRFSICTISIMILLLFFGSIFQNITAVKGNNDVLASAKAMAVVEANTNTVLYSHNKDMRLPMASLTKIITAIVVIENSDDLDELVDIADESVGIEGTSIYLTKGEEMTIRELLLGLMLASGNDSAMALAYHIAGSEESFVGLMNDFVQRIGAENTHVVNPHGLDADHHFTTAFDLAIITSYALKNDDFREIVSTKRATIRGNDKVEARYLKHKNKLLFSDENCIGVKTGFTDNAGRCLVHATKQDNGMEIVTVLLNCGPMFEEADRLNNLAVSNYDYVEFVKPYNFVGTVNINNGSSNTTNVATIKGFSTIIRKVDHEKYKVVYDIPESIEAPIKNGEKIGCVSVIFEENVIFEAELVSIDTVDNIDLKYMLDNILNKWYA